MEKRLKELEKASNTADLLNSFKNLGNDLMDLAKLSGKRQAVSGLSIVLLGFLGSVSHLLVRQFKLTLNSPFNDSSFVSLKYSGLKRST